MQLARLDEQSVQARVIRFRRGTRHSLGSVVHHPEDDSQPSGNIAHSGQTRFKVSRIRRSVALAETAADH